MAYLPPAPLNFDFSAAYPGTLNFDFLQLNVRQDITGRGADSSEFGGHEVRNKSPAIALDTYGIDSAAYGLPFVFLYPAAAQSFGLLNGIAPPSFAGPVVNPALAFNFVTPMQGATEGDGLHFEFTPAGGVRRLYPPGWLSYRSGAHQVIYSPYVRPPGFEATEWGDKDQTFVRLRSELNQIRLFEGWDSLQIGNLSAGRALIFNFDRPGYEPPTPELPFNFVDRLDYPQYADLVGFGIDSLEFGIDTRIGARLQYYPPYGFDSSEFGNHLVADRIRTVGLQSYGIYGALFGTASLANKSLGIQVIPGLLSLNIPIPLIYLNTRYVNHVNGSHTLTFGPDTEVTSTIGDPRTVKPLSWDSLSFEPGQNSTLPQVAHELRFISFDEGFDSLRLGAAEVSFRVRHIFQTWTTAHTEYGLANLGYTPATWIAGIDAGAFGSPTVAFGNVIAPIGFDSAEMAEPVVKHWQRFVRVDFWTEQDTFGEHLVYNKVQYVDVIQLWSSDNFGPDHDVRNRNRHVVPEQFFPPNISRNHQIRHLGQQTLPSAGDQSEIGEHLVAFRIRTIYPDSVRFAGFVDKYHFVHNSAWSVAPAGFDTSVVSDKHHLWFNRQDIVSPRYGDQDAYGRPFVAFRIRELQQYFSEYGYKSGNAWVSHSPRPIGHQSDEAASEFGRPYIVTHKNVLHVQPFHTFEPNYPHIRNVTPQLYPLMGQQLEFSDPWVSRSPRGIEARSITDPWIGSHSLSFRDRTLPMPGFDAARIGGHKIFRDGPEPPSNRYIEPDGINPENPHLVGLPKVQGSPHPMGWDSLEVSPATWVRLQGCSPYWEAPDSLFGFGIPFINGTRYVQHIQLQDATEWPFPYARVSPHTIWCRHDTPQQAVDNNPQSVRRWQDMDTGNDGTAPPPPWFGDAFVATPHTVTLQHYHVPFESHDMVGGWVGTPSVQSTIRYIILDDGIYSFKSGFAKLPGKQKTFARDWESHEFGQATVSIEPLDEQYVYPSGWSSFASLKSFIEHKNRQIYPQGNTHTVFGDNKPMVYHKPRGPSGVSGTDMSEFGEDTWVSHRIREIFPEGHDSFEEGYTPGKFNDRLKITKGEGRPFLTVGDTLEMGFPDVSYGSGGTQHIRPYMIPPPQYCEPHSVEEG